MVADNDGRLEYIRSLDSKLPWDQRLKEIRASIPTIEGFDWRRLFDKDIDVAGRLIRDVLKADQAVPGRPGPRPSLDRARAEPRLDEWFGKDPTDRPYTTMIFADAFTLLTNKKSITQVARRTELPRTMVFRLLRGRIQPSVEIIEQVAKAYGKDPSYFTEFRIATIAATLIAGMSDSPDLTIRYYESLF